MHPGTGILSHRDSTGWHGDRPTCKRDECIVPVLSLGAARRFLLKLRDGGRSIALAPASGDLVVMGGRRQRDWLHCVPRQARTAGMRISVNFSSGFRQLRRAAVVRRRSYQGDVCVRMWPDMTAPAGDP